LPCPGSTDLGDSVPPLRGQCVSGRWRIHEGRRRTWSLNRTVADPPAANTLESAVFDSLDAASGGAVDVAAEAYLERKICDMCGEGAERRERHEPLRRWRDSLGHAGLAGDPACPFRFELFGHGFTCA
jgi:hypothetical protein